MSPLPKSAFPALCMAIGISCAMGQTFTRTDVVSSVGEHGFTMMITEDYPICDVDLKVDIWTENQIFQDEGDDGMDINSLDVDLELTNSMGTTSAALFADACEDGHNLLTVTFDDDADNDVNSVCEDRPGPSVSGYTFERFQRLLYGG